MSKESVVTDGQGHIVAVDRVTEHDDGSSTTVRSEADFHCIGGMSVGRIQSVTENSPDGTSTCTKK